MTAGRVLPSYSPREWLARALTALGYAVVIHFAITRFSVDGIVSVVYPTPGISLALLTLVGLCWWPAVYLGEVLGNLSTGTALGPSLALSAVDTLKPLVGAWLLRRSADFDAALGRLQDFMRLLVVALAVSGPGALAGTAILAQAGVPAPVGTAI